MEITIGTANPSICTFDAAYHTEDLTTEAIIMRSTFDRNTLLQCSDGPPTSLAANQLTYKYTIFVNNNKAKVNYVTTSYLDGTTGLEPWSSGDNECN